MQNPAITNGQPVPMEGEMFVLSRDGISFSAKSGSTKLESYGTLYLSTLRMVIVCDISNSRTNFQGFDMPLATLSEEKFNQPIFGANNMTGSNPPLDGSGLTDSIKWCISFRNGGVGTFLPFFFRLLQEMRQRMSGQQQNTTSPVPAMVAQTLVQGAFVDPSDPTRLYVPQ